MWTARIVNIDKRPGAVFVTFGYDHSVTPSRSFTETVNLGIPDSNTTIALHAKRKVAELESIDQKVFTAGAVDLGVAEPSKPQKLQFIEKLNVLRKYKEALTLGVINQATYDAKLAEVLALYQNGHLD